MNIFPGYLGLVQAPIVFNFAFCVFRDVFSCANMQVGLQLKSKSVQRDTETRIPSPVSISNETAQVLATSIFKKGATAASQQGYTLGFQDGYTRQFHSHFNEITADARVSGYETGVRAGISQSKNMVLGEFGETHRRLTSDLNPQSSNLERNKVKITEKFQTIFNQKFKAIKQTPELSSRDEIVRKVPVEKKEVYGQLTQADLQFEADARLKAMTDIPENLLTPETVTELTQQVTQNAGAIQPRQECRNSGEWSKRFGATLDISLQPIYSKVKFLRGLDFFHPAVGLSVQKDIQTFTQLKKEWEGQLFLSVSNQKTNTVISPPISDISVKFQSGTRGLEKRVDFLLKNPLISSKKVSPSENESSFSLIREERISAKNDSFSETKSAPLFEEDYGSKDCYVAYVTSNTAEAFQGQVHSETFASGRMAMPQEKFELPVKSGLSAESALALGIAGVGAVCTGIWVGHKLRKSQEK